VVDLEGSVSRSHVARRGVASAAWCKLLRGCWRDQRDDVGCVGRAIVALVG
jgi:hypothetical protein